MQDDERITHFRGGEKPKDGYHALNGDFHRQGLCLWQNLAYIRGKETP